MKHRSITLLACFGMLIANTVVADLSATNTESFQIRNKKFGDLLRPEGANGADGTRIVLYPAEPWKCMTWKLQPAGESVYHVQNHFTRKTFAANVGETNVVQVAYSKEANSRPLWRFKKLADGSYEIIEVKSSAALTAFDESGSVRITLAPWQDSDAQKWVMEKIDPAKLTM